LLVNPAVSATRNIDHMRYGVMFTIPLAGAAAASAQQSAAHELD